MALNGAWYSVNFARFSLTSKTMDMEIIKAMEKKYVPINFLMMYQSIL